MPTFEEHTTEEIAWGILVKAGLGNDGFVDPSSLESRLPSRDNLAATVVEGEEQVFDEYGMPLTGNYPNSYDFAPTDYARVFIEYPRQGSESRQKASQKGWRVNEGAAYHLEDNYSSMMSILRAIVLAKRQMLNEEPTDDARDLTTRESLDVLNAAVSMWSYMIYRKKGSTARDKLPTEVALLHRSMSGVRMSLLSLFIHDEPHSFRKTKGWQDEPFSAESWHGAVEASGKLVGSTTKTKQECVAPTIMIRRVLETIVDPPSGDRSLSVADLQAGYRIDPEVLIAYGQPWYNLEQATAEKNEFATSAVEMIKELLEVVNVADRIPTARNIREMYDDQLRSETSRINTHIHDSFLAAVAILGYDPKSFTK